MRFCPPYAVAQLMRGAPLVPSLQAQAEPPVIDAQIAIGADEHGRGRNRRDLLRHHADIELVAPEIAVAVEAEAVVEALKQIDVALEAEIGWSGPTRSGRRRRATETVAGRTGCHQGHQNSKIGIPRGESLAFDRAGANKGFCRHPIYETRVPQLVQPGLRLPALQFPLPRRQSRAPALFGHRGSHRRTHPITRDRAQTTVVTFWQKRTSRSIPVLPFSNSLRLLRFSTSHPHRPVHRSPSRPALYEPRRLRLYRMRHADRERQSGGGKRQDIVKLGHDGPPL